MQDGLVIGCGLETIPSKLDYISKGSAIHSHAHYYYCEIDKFHSDAASDVVRRGKGMLTAAAQCIGVL
jgi:hypothetical protein